MADASPRNATHAQHGASTGHRRPPELAEPRCAVTPLIAYLADHKADTLRACVDAVEAFGARARHAAAPVPARRRLAPASRPPPTSSCAGADRRMLVAALCAPSCVLCFITFRSWRAVRGGADAAASSRRSCARR